MQCKPFRRATRMATITAFAGVVPTGMCGTGATHSTCSDPTTVAASYPLSLVPFSPPPPRAIESGIALVDNASAFDPSTGDFARQASSKSSIMSDLLSLSVFQVLSVLSFLTSILAVLRVGSVTLNRFSPRIDSDVGQSHMNLGAGKPQPWNWSGLPVSFSIGSLIGEEERIGVSKDTIPGYVGGTELVRMNWPAIKYRAAPPMYTSQPPLSMAKLIMSRHLQRKGSHMRIPRRTPGMPRLTPPSRLMESLV